MARLSKEEKEMLIRDLKALKEALEDRKVRETIFNNIIRGYYLNDYDAYRRWRNEVGRIAKSKSLRSAEKWVKEAIIKDLITAWEISPQTAIRYVKKVFSKRELDELNKAFAKMVKEDAKEEWESIKRERKERKLNGF